MPLGVLKYGTVMSKVNLDNKTILVTGGCGFIGSNFIEMVLREYTNLTVVNVDYLGVGSREDFNPVTGANNTYHHVFLNTANLHWTQTLRHVVPDYIFHFAAESHVDRSINSPADFMVANITGITGLLEYMRINHPRARLINISTDEVYGHLELDGFDFFTESCKLNPRSPYSASKASADLIANSYHTTYGLDIITTRCCNNFGPNQHDEKFIPTVIRSLLQGEKIPVYGTGKNIREWIHVVDHNKSILEIADIGVAGEVYNISGSIGLTNLEIISEIVKILHPEDNRIRASEYYIEFVEDRKGHDLRYSIESTKYFRDFALKPFSQALEDTVAFYAGKYTPAG